MKERMLPLIILIFSVISIFLIKFSYVSLGISLICLILSIIFSRKNIRILIVTIIISIATIITNGIILYKSYLEAIDVNEGVNVVLGTWLYNQYGGTYVFKDDYTYIQYSNSDTSDNYCVGKYEYSYGGISNDGVIVRQDENYYYYNLDLKEDYCIIMGKEDYSKYEKKMVFALNKGESSNLLINKKSENVIELKKVNE